LPSRAAAITSADTLLEGVAKDQGGPVRHLAERFVSPLERIAAEERVGGATEQQDGEHANERGADQKATMQRG
jgi:hypothetical protein